MDNIIKVLIIVYFCVVNLISVIVTIEDKYKAKRHKWRIKERTLLILSALGGSVSMYVTMHIIHHKTKKLKFMLGIPIIIILQTALLLFFCFYAGG